MQDYSAYSDNSLLDLIRNGDRDAFSAIYNRYWKQIFYIAAKKFDSYLAEDIVQEIFTDLWCRREDLCIRENLSKYLAVAVKYRVINLQARQRRMKNYKEYKTHKKDIIDNSTECYLSFEELKEQLSKCIEHLPEKAKLSFTLSRELGMTYKEIANYTALTPKAVERHIARSLKTLAINLKHFLMALLF